MRHSSLTIMFKELCAHEVFKKYPTTCLLCTTQEVKLIGISNGANPQIPWISVLYQLNFLTKLYSTFLGSF